jgi:hypothetical protein
MVSSSQSHERPSPTLFTPLEFVSTLKDKFVWEYLKSAFYESIRNSNLSHSDLSVTGPSTLSIFFNLGTKAMGGGSCKKGGKATGDLENFLLEFFRLM